MAPKFKLTPLYRFARASDELPIQQPPSIPYFENHDPLVRQPIRSLTQQTPDQIEPILPRCECNRRFFLVLRRKFGHLFGIDIRGVTDDEIETLIKQLIKPI